MYYFWGVLAGLAWGALAALLNGLINKKCVEKNSSKSMLFANAAKIVIDIAALLTVLLLRNLLPFSYEAALLCTALSLSMLGIVLSYRIANS